MIIRVRRRLLFVVVFCFHVSGLTFLEPDRTGLGLKSLRKGQTAASLQGRPFEGWMAATSMCEDVCVQYRLLCCCALCL